MFSFIQKLMIDRAISKHDAMPGVPLHGKGGAQDVLDLHMRMRAMRPDGGGFEKAPTSRKNRRFHVKRPTTRLEHLADRVMRAERAATRDDQRGAEL